MIIAEIRTSSGVLVRIHDDCMAPRGSDEERRAIEAQRRVAHEILVSIARVERLNDERGRQDDNAGRQE